MRIVGILVFILFCSQALFAQDTTKITYSEVQDTLVKQRFIDRYENVFMTKVPTRHMFKVGISQYYRPMDFPIYNERPFTNLSLQHGYEFKFLPSFSLALAGHIPNYGTGVPLRHTWSSTVLDAQLRWFIDMKRRIASGKSANNFSGNYVALFYNMPGTLWAREIVGLKLGFQRRFFNAGFMDFAISIQKEIQSFYSLSTQASFGIAFGDWKKSKNQAICEVLFCDREIHQQWKIKLPEVTLGYYLNRIRTSVAYEHKVKSSPFSINYQLDMGASKGFVYFYENDIRSLKEYSQVYPYTLSISRELYASFSLQPRYYFLQKRQQALNSSGNELSSFYTGLNLENYFYSSRHSVSIPGNGDKIFYPKQNTLHIGPMLGFQQRVFKNGYIDLNTSYNYKHEFFEKVNSFGFRGNLGVGIAF